MNNRNILDVRNFSCGYKNGFYIHNISFVLENGDFVGIIGPNGSGKTTLMKGIYGDIPSISGEILFENRNINTISMREKAQKIAIVSQFTPIANITAEEYVLTGRLPYRKSFQFFDKIEDIQIAHHYMNLTNTYKLKNKLVSQLSGGEQQMISIASALSQEPDLLLLDEPTSHLDIAHQMNFMNLIKGLNQELNLSVVMIIHDLNLSSEYCKQIIMMKKGKLFAKGLPNDVLSHRNIQEVYNSNVAISTNPISGRAVVLPVAEQTIKLYKR